MSTLTIFETAISALNANSKAISVAAQNIANANTPGYSRQRAIIQANQSQVIGGLEFGRGARVADVQRIFSNFAELRLRDATSSQSETKASADALSEVGTLFNELTSDGLSVYLSNFFNSFQDVANDPTASGPRQDLLNKAQILVNRFNTLSTGLVDARENIDNQIQDNVSKINTLASSIYNLTQQINNTEESLVLRDQREQKIKELSELTDVTTVENESGLFQLYIANGMLLVHSNGTATLSVLPDAGNDGLSDVMYTLQDGGAATDISDRFQSGSLKGLLEVRDDTITDYQDDLDELAYRLVVAVNTLHTAGYDLDGNTAQRFFGNLASATDAASNISLDAAVDGLPRAIAAASSSGALPGGNTVALNISALKNSSVAFGSGSTTFSAFYANLLAGVGTDQSTAQASAQFADDVYLQAQAQREQVSGVSMEEEQANIIKYQAAFQASSRLVSIANTLLETLVNLGR